MVITYKNHTCNLYNAIFPYGNHTKLFGKIAFSKLARGEGEGPGIPHDFRCKIYHHFFTYFRNWRATALPRLSLLYFKIHSLNKYLFSLYYMPDAALGNEDTVGKDTEKTNPGPKNKKQNPSSKRAYVIVRDAVTKINILE